MAGSRQLHDGQYDRIQRLVAERVLLFTRLHPLSSCRGFPCSKKSRRKKTIAAMPGLVCCSRCLYVPCLLHHHHWMYNQCAELAAPPVHYLPTGHSFVQKNQKLCRPTSSAPPPPPPVHPTPIPTSTSAPDRWCIWGDFDHRHVQPYPRIRCCEALPL